MVPVPVPVPVAVARARITPLLSDQGDADVRAAALALREVRLDAVLAASLEGSVAVV